MPGFITSLVIIDAMHISPGCIPQIEVQVLMTKVALAVLLCALCYA